jgi:Soluble NSF attachment protein, SNAP
VAQFAGTLEEYDKAVDLFERVAAKSLDNNLTKWSVREYLFKAMICTLCIQVNFLPPDNEFQGYCSIKSHTGKVYWDGSHLSRNQRVHPLYSKAKFRQFLIFKSLR